jgi:hypothetical protein
MSFLSLIEVPSWRRMVEQFPAVYVKPLMVFELPGDIITAIFSTWIDLQALARLDTAMCGSKARPRFLSSIGDRSFVADTSAIGGCPNTGQERCVQQLARWITQRRIKVKAWIVNGDVAESCSLDFLNLIAGPHVRSLQLRKLSSPGAARVFPTFVASHNSLQVLVMEHCQDWGSFANSDDGCVQFPHLRNLHIKNLTGDNVVQSVTGLLNAAPGLTDLRLSAYTHCPINDESLQALSKNAARLEILELDIERQDFTSAAVISLAQSCTRLKTLALLCGDKVNDTVVEAFALNCSRLEGLQLSGAFTPAALSAVASHCGPRLRYLTLSMTHCAPDGLIAIAKHCRQLEELQLCNCGSLPAGPLVQLLSSLPRLRELLLGGLRVITDEVLVAIATHLPNLQHLSLLVCGGGYTKVGAQALATSLTRLQRFCLRPGGIAVFTPALRRRWQETSPGLVIYQDAAPTRYFERLCW